MRLKTGLTGFAVGLAMICFPIVITKSRITLVRRISQADDQTPEAAQPAPLPGKGLRQHPFLYCGEWDTRKPVQTMYIVRGGKVVWSYSVTNKDELDDCHLLSNNHVLFARKNGATELTPDKQIVWNYDAPPGTEIHSAQPIGRYKVLIMQNSTPAKLILIDKNGFRSESENSFFVVVRSRTVSL